MAADGHRHEARIPRNVVIEVTTFRRIGAGATGSGGLRPSKCGDQLTFSDWCRTMRRGALSFRPPSERAEISLVGGGVSLAGGGARSHCPSDAVGHPACYGGPVASCLEDMALSG